jgi:Flp pilus assembly protein TadG
LNMKNNKPYKIIHKFINKEDGQMLVLGALFMTVLLGFGALAIDVGRLAVEKSHLQNALDAAALAAVQDLPDTSSGYTHTIGIVTDYLDKNGYAYFNIEPITAGSFSNANKTITLKGTKKVDYTFAKIIEDEDSGTVAAKAAAAIITPFETMDYALFSGSEIKDLHIKGSKTKVIGNVHANQDIKGHLEVIGDVSANGSIDSKVVQTGDRMLSHPKQNMSTLTTQELADLKTRAQSTGTYYSTNKSFSADELNTALAAVDVIYVEGTVTTNGSGVWSASGCIIATDDIIFNGSYVTIGDAVPVCLYSSAGNINLNGGSSNIDGIVWAPTGTVTFNGSGGVLSGRICGDVVALNGNMTIDSSSGTEPDLGIKRFRLVE